MLPPDIELINSLIDTEGIYQNAPSGYMSILADGTIVKINITLLAWLLYGEEEILYRMKFSDLLSKGGLIHYEMFFRPMMSINGNIKELNYEFVRKNGTTFPALINGNGIMDKDGKLILTNLVLTDITQRNRYEKELLKAKNIASDEKKRFELLADLSPDMIWTVDNEGVVTYVNRFTLQYFRLAAADRNTEILFNKIHPADKKIILRKWLQHDAGDGFKVNIRLTNNRKDFEWFGISVTPFNNDLNKIKWFGTCASINEHVVAMQRKDEFIQVAGHELNTPVTILKTYLHLIEMSDLPAPLPSYIAKCISTLNNLRFLIATLLNVSVINSGQLHLEVSEFSLNGLLEEIIEQLNSSVTTHSILSELPVEEVCVKADKKRLMQVIINLVNNAVKYSAASSSVILRSLVNELDSTVTISVQDFGMGISAEDQEKIFEKYFRTSAATSSKGLGLGLYITQNIIAAHDSKLTVTSTVGEGSVFSFTLPCTIKTT
ncbi:MAG: PAS domain-containing sensor histidine kinase [Ginsengibacter sp.]